jgi:hypothetical protein
VVDVVRRRERVVERRFVAQRDEAALSLTPGGDQALPG